MGNVIKIENFKWLYFFTKKSENITGSNVRINKIPRTIKKIKKKKNYKYNES